MALSYIGKSGRRYTIITPALGKGGEGSVYKISGMPNCVLKIFTDGKKTETRHRKLLAMISTPISDEAMKQVTWPIDVVYENNQFAGYVMPLVNNNENLNVIYSDKYNYTLSEKITIAMNLCSAINSVHNAGQVCGDLNPQNISVDPQHALVTLVDTDSYHITEANGNRIYRCEVGLPEYLPREIQEKMKNGQDLRNAPLPTFTKYTDLFALAVHIFALLMNGCHPFACAVNNNVNIAPLTTSQTSITAPQPIDNICTGFFPFKEKRNGITIPKYAPEFDMLPKKIRELFVRAFVDGHNNPQRRPDATEWYYALSDLKKQLTRCSKDGSHIYPNHLQKCPWCKIEKRMSQAIVPTTSIARQQLQQTKINITNNTNNSVPVGRKAQPSSHKSSDSIWKNEKIFWIITYLISIGLQAGVHFLSGNMVVNEVFGTEYRSGIEYWGSNLAVWAGPWGFIICAAIGVYLYNSQWSTKGKLYGYKWYHYVLSVLTSIVFSIGWILLILLLSIAILVIVGAVLIAIICGIFSGS